MNKNFPLEEDYLGYYTYDKLKYSNIKDIVTEEDRIRGEDLYYIAEKFRNYDSQSKKAYEFIDFKLREVKVQYF